ncbi:ribonuclease P protein component [Capnocytophaga stomatis]|uniref:Ribonuclease P protein component n=1 Tax=Capnocytophaga stomatis TaxID=1848904 RepID=A0A250FY39_9FLAO|nr:ribonuclease P protein component [Capnocytophaga stomatis]ATA89375.1 ribonuclease P protein component [Capnocytophaga stomatis]GIJ93574.1 hypothetical protein CAPN002_07920 [Capnocytophaga stomatis]
MKNVDYSFPKSERLRKLKYIQQLFSEGKSVQSYPLKMIYCPIESDLESQFQVLVSVPKRGFKRAVHRNRIKRLIRESYRLQKHFLGEITCEKYALAIIFIGKEIPDYDLIFRKVMRCFEKFGEEIKTQ